MPQGGVDAGEDVRIAALRELKEEIGSDKAEILRIHDEVLRYDIPEHVRARISWGDKFAGQEQTWVALRFTGDDADIKLDADVHPEFARFQWVDLKRVPQMIVPFKVKIYEEVVKIFSDIT